MRANPCSVATPKMAVCPSARSWGEPASAARPCAANGRGGLERVFASDSLQSLQPIRGSLLDLPLGHQQDFRSRPVTGGPLLPLTGRRRPTMHRQRRGA